MHHAHPWQLILTLLTLLVPSPSPAQRVLRATVDLRIDAAKYDLRTISGVAVSRSGRIAVGQRTERLIRFFDAKTGPLGSYKGEGRGTVPVWLGWLGDTLWVNEPALHRFTLIAPDLTLLRSIGVAGALTFPLQNPKINVHFGTATPLGLLPDGSLVARLSIGPTGQIPNWFPWTDKNRSPYVRMFPNGRFVALIGARSSGSNGRCTVGTMSGSVETPFCSSGLWAQGDWRQLTEVLQDNMSWNEGRYRVTRIGLTGDTLLDRNYIYHPIPIPARVADSVRTARIAEMPGDTKQQDAMRRLQFPKNYAPFAQAINGEDGTLWLEESPPGALRHWQILDSKGNPLGTVELPGRLRVLVVGKGFVWAAEPDANGLESLLRLVVR